MYRGNFFNESQYYRNIKCLNTFKMKTVLTLKLVTYHIRNKSPYRY